jgi:hypothetical protein
MEFAAMHDKSLPPARYEHDDVTGSFIWIGSATIALLLLATAWVVFTIFPDTLSGPFLGLPLPEYPAPRLQVSSRADMEKFYAEELRRLDSVGWVDKTNGKVHIPISVAMRLVASRGIQDWPSPARRPP